VFLVYGMHHCANVVTRREGVPEAVLLRAAEPPGDAPARLLSGPGKLCAALGITVRDSGLDLVSDGPVRIFVPRRRAQVRIGVSPRIGIDYAGDAKDWPMRFFDAQSGAVSVRGGRVRDPSLRSR
jgi:DNA-3-methyladenine glycosylase